MKINSLKTALLSVSLAVSSVTLSACASNDSHSSSGQYVLGTISQQALLSQEKYFQQGYLEFKPTPVEIKLINTLPEGVEIKTYFGSWCHDSQREVPRMLKLLEGSKVKLSLYGLPISKKDDQGRAEAAGVKYTPTFIVMHNGNEIGRIIERPKSGSLAKDIAGFLK